MGPKARIRQPRIPVFIKKTVFTEGSAAGGVIKVIRNGQGARVGSSVIADTYHKRHILSRGDARVWPQDRFVDGQVRTGSGSCAGTGAGNIKSLTEKIFLIPAKEAGRSQPRNSDQIRGKD